MFSFLYPTLLWALLAVAIPILIHLFSRQRVKKIEFSSLIFLKSLEKTRLKAIKIKSLILLLIRSLIIFFVVLAFARPSARTGFASKLGAKAKSSVLFLIDNSYRMGYETKKGSLLSLALRKGEELLKTYKEGDELYLVTYNSIPQKFLSYPTFDSSLISRAILETELTFEPANLDQGLKAGFDLLARSKNENKEIYLFTDLKDRELPFLQRWDKVFKDKGIKLFIVRLSDEQKENWGIKKIEVEGALEKETPFEIRGIVANYSHKPAQNLLLSLYLDGKRVSQTNLDLKGEEEKKFDFTQQAIEAGLHSGCVEISDDNLLADNKRFFAFNLPEKIGVLLVGDKGGKEDYLRLALNPKGEGKNQIELTQIDSKFFSRVELSNYQVIVLSGLSGISSEDLKRLDKFLNSGGGVLFSFGKGEEDVYAEVCRKYLNSTLKGKSDFSGKSQGFLTLEKMDLFHPVFQPYKELDKTKFPQLKFFSIYEVTPGKKAKVLANFSSGSPALIESSSGSGKILAFMSSYEPEFSDLGEHTIFVPFVRRSVEYLCSSLFPLEEFLVGEKIRREFESPKIEKVELVDPDNFKVTLIPEFFKDKLILKLEEMRKPGIYKLQSGGEVIDQLAVNLDVRDSDFEPLTDSELKNDLKDSPNLLVIGPDQDLEKEILKTRYGKELSKNFLWLASIFLILEMYLSKSRKKDLEHFSNFSKGEEIAQTS
ncbi:MAG: BatA and WFA domain-containing protein [candidate division Zixibacteria bacterium]|nr:BatA and WFA domain-containing protein [candidate division Zixibacteria bacterium]